MWTVVNFGKWQGKELTLPQIILKDPDWFFWAVQDNVFKGPLASQAAILAQRAKRIKLKKNPPENWEIEYVISYEGKFSDFNLVPADREMHIGSSSTVRRKHLDLSFPRSIKGYDKLGCQLMLKTFKYHWFGNTNARLTQKKCEEFFDDLSNFI